MVRCRLRLFENEKARNEHRVGLGLARQKPLKSLAEYYCFWMPSDLFPDDLDFGQTIQIPRFGPGKKSFRRYLLAE
jgi:hypothetical protein